MATSAQAKKPEGARSFAVFIKDCADGDLHTELSEELHTLLGKLNDLADEFHITAKGELTLKLKLSVDQKGVMGIDHDVVAKCTTKRKRPTAQAWCTPGGNVTFVNPRQLTLGVREVPRESVREDEDDVADKPATREA